MRSPVPRTRHPLIVPAPPPRLRLKAYRAFAQRISTIRRRSSDCYEELMLWPNLLASPGR
jgi:hypothetical protein